MRPAGFNDIYLDNMVTITFLDIRSSSNKKKNYILATLQTKAFYVYEPLVAFIVLIIETIIKLKQAREHK